MNLIALAAVLSVLQFVTSQTVNTNPYLHTVSLDPRGRYNLTWLVDWSQRRVTFNVSVLTNGYVGFGLAHRNSAMQGADIVVGGVLPDGTTYFSDRFGRAGQVPEVMLDPSSQDWTLHAAQENYTHTFLSFSRPFDTCDTEYDIPITDDLSTLIWAFSEVDDELQYHFQNRGSFDVYLLDPDLTPDLVEFRQLEQMAIQMNMSRFPMNAVLNLPSVDTMYWCHFFKAPTTSKQHIIGFSTDLPTETDREHVHHLLVHRCRAPPGVNSEQLFDTAARTQGTECFFVNEPHTLPTEYCQEVVHLWGVGGRPIFFPDTAGLAMSEDGPEYFMVQVHYDNPNIMNRTVNFTVNAYYTDNLRENDVGMLPLGELTPGATSIVIPPSSLNHVIHGHCPPECLQEMLPAEGVTVFAGFLHTHLLGIGVRFLHFRGDQELPWISNADNYNFNYQQFRLLIQERRVMPGDQLGMRCTYDTTSRNGATVVGGHSTRDEMCTGHLYYYTRRQVRFSFCRSELKTEEYMNLLGIRNTTWDAARRQMMVTEPAEFSGLTVYDYANQHIEWDLGMRQEIQRHQLYEPQATQCPIVDNTPPDLQEWQEAEEMAWNPSLRGVPRYRKPPQCSRRSPWSTDTTTTGTITAGGSQNRPLKRLESGSTTMAPTTTSTSTSTTTTSTTMRPSRWQQQRYSRFWREGTRRPGFSPTQAPVSGRNNWTLRKITT